MPKYTIKNLHKKLLNAGILTAPITTSKQNNLFIDFNYKQNSFLNFKKYTIQFYEVVRFFELVKKLSLNIIYIQGSETPSSKLLQMFAQINKTNYFTGRWISGFFTNRLFLTTKGLFTKNETSSFVCSQKPHVAIVFWSPNIDLILDELHKSGIITVLIGNTSSKKYIPSFYLPGGDLSIKNYLFYFTFFTQIFYNKNFTKTKNFFLRKNIND